MVAERQREGGMLHAVSVCCVWLGFISDGSCVCERVRACLASFHLLLIIYYYYYYYYRAWILCYSQFSAAHALIGCTLDNDFMKSFSCYSFLSWELQYAKYLF